jgi:hypothetical protein
MKSVRNILSAIFVAVITATMSLQTLGAMIQNSAPQFCSNTSQLGLTTTNVSQELYSPIYAKNGEICECLGESVATSRFVAIPEFIEIYSNSIQNLLQKSGLDMQQEWQNVLENSGINPDVIKQCLEKQTLPEIFISELKKFANKLENQFDKIAQNIESCENQGWIAYSCSWLKSWIGGSDDTISNAKPIKASIIRAIGQNIVSYFFDTQTQQPKSLMQRLKCGDKTIFDTPFTPILIQRMCKKDCVGMQPNITPKNIRIVSITTKGRESFAEISEKSEKSYADKHGYSFVIYKDSESYSAKTDLANQVPTQWACSDKAHELPEEWMKFSAVYKQLQDPNIKWVLWMDDDMYITNPDIKLEDYIEKYGNDKYLIIAKDPHYGRQNRDSTILFNNGIFLLKNCEQAKDFLRRTWELGVCKNKYTQRGTSLLEQQSMTEIYNSDPEVKTHVQMLETRDLNAIIRFDKYNDPVETKWKSGDFVAHVTGVCTEFREHALKYLDESLTQKTSPDVVNSAIDKFRNLGENKYCKPAYTSNSDTTDTQNEKARYLELRRLVDLIEICQDQNCDKLNELALKEAESSTQDETIPVLELRLRLFKALVEKQYQPAFEPATAFANLAKQNSDFNIKMIGTLLLNTIESHKK